MNRTIKLIIAAAIILPLMLVLLIVGMLYWQATLVVNVPDQPYTETPADYGMPDYETVTVTAEDGVTIRGWFIPPTREDGATIMYLHGHKGNLLDLMPEAQVFQEMGFGAMLFDFRGRGMSEDAPVTMGVTEVYDTEAILAFLQEHPAVNPARIGIYGYSMGAATAIMTAAQHPELRVVVSDSSYSSFFDIVHDRTTGLLGAPPVIIPDLYIAMTNQISGEDLSLASPIDAIPDITQPIAFIHGTVDTTIDDTHSGEMYEIAQFPKLYYRVFTGDHGESLETNPEDYRDIVVQFVERHLTD